MYGFLERVGRKGICYQGNSRCTTREGLLGWIGGTEFVGENEIQPQKKLEAGARSDEVRSKITDNETKNL